MNAVMYAEWAKHYDPHQEEIQILSRHGISFEGKKVLEIGSGTGRFTERVLPLCAEIVCVDPDKNALSVLENNLSDYKLTTICGTLNTVSVPRGYFDYVVFSWSIYLVEDIEKNLKLSLDLLAQDGCLIVLQANSGEYEEEIAYLYTRYNPLGAYEAAYDSLPQLIKKVFGNVTCDTLNTYFVFDNIDQVIDCSLFFIEDEEGRMPSEKLINTLRNRLCQYASDDGTVKMSDIVSVFIAKNNF